jgi:putative ABC transport system ATP-binding protein/lipoprotein-releasing system ATP-binding protein
MAQIELVDIEKSFVAGDQTIRAVMSVSLTIEKGDFLSIVGHSGSGKTTLLSIIGGIMRPSSGRVLFEGTDICSLDDDRLSSYRNTRVGFMFQFASLLPVLTAQENLLLPGLFGPGAGSGNWKKAAELLDMVGLKDKILAYPSQLSGGQQRRVAIARALMNDPGVILADEPTGDLDEETEAEIMALFNKLNREKNVTFVFITHNRELASHAKRQLIMSQGSIKEL